MKYLKQANTSRMVGANKIRKREIFRSSMKRRKRRECMETARMEAPYSTRNIVPSLELCPKNSAGIRASRVNCLHHLVGRCCRSSTSGSVGGNYA